MTLIQNHPQYRRRMGGQLQCRTCARQVQPGDFRVTIFDDGRVLQILECPKCYAELDHLEILTPEKVRDDD